MQERGFCELDRLLEQAMTATEGSRYARCSQARPRINGNDPAQSEVVSFLPECHLFLVAGSNAR